MSKIRGRGNRSTELALVRIFKENGITGWRRYIKIEGRPDFAFPRQKLAVFVDGCFWHACPKCGNLPKQNRKFWKTKLNKNQKRDRSVNRLLKAECWSVLRIWEHELSNSGSIAKRVLAILARLEG